MQQFILLVPVFAALASSCSGAAESTASKDPKAGTAVADTTTRTPPPAPDAAKPDPCGAAALGLGTAPKLELWTPPPGCSPRGEGTTILHSDDELTPRLECTAGLNHLVDFTKQALLVVGHTLSPAGAGVLAFDDGKVVTLVSRQRSSCPGDPMPMPMNATAWFLLPAGAERTFAAKTCTLDPQCR